MFEIKRDPLHVEEVVDKVKSDSSGAIATFIGTVRNESMGKRVLYLEYDAYEEMAIKKLREIGEEIKKKWELDKIAVTHRIGRLDIGERSVVIAVSAPHRKDALLACQYIINRIKEIVPIWKKEVWEDGETWVGKQ
jgi:molybdopterin synthase catalytic subunit